ncbi:unnamed protein product [Arctogadus glacialis]
MRMMDRTPQGSLNMTCAALRYTFHTVAAYDHVCNTSNPIRPTRVQHGPHCNQTESDESLMQVAEVLGRQRQRGLRMGHDPLPPSVSLRSNMSVSEACKERLNLQTLSQRCSLGSNKVAVATRWGDQVGHAEAAGWWSSGRCHVTSTAIHHHGAMNDTHGLSLSRYRH